MAKAKTKKASPKAFKRAFKKNSTTLPKTSHTMKIRPLGDRVVIRPLSQDEMGTKSLSGIIIPDTVSKEKPEQGIVVSVGPGKYEDGARVPMQVMVDDRVVFSKYGYDEVKVEGIEYYIVSESSLLAVIKD